MPLLGEVHHRVEPAVGGDGLAVAEQLQERPGPAAGRLQPAALAQPWSKTMRQVLGASMRQIEEKRANGLPSGLSTGPVLSARVPEASTSTRSGAHENGAAGFSKKRFQYVVTCSLPRSGSDPETKTASSEMKAVNAA